MFWHQRTYGNQTFLILTHVQTIFEIEMLDVI